MSQSLLTAKEVAAILQCSPSWVKQHASGSRRPSLPSVKMGTMLRFRLSDIEQFITRWTRKEE